LRRVWTRFWQCASVLLVLCAPLPAGAPQPQQQLRGAATKKATQSAASAHGFDELTLAGLRPGRDPMAKAEHLFPAPSTLAYAGTSRTWQDPCRNQSLSIIADSDGTILEVRVAEAASEVKRDCANEPPDRWVTGHGLTVGSSCSQALALYGQPGSRGPSTKGGQQLELLYYAFDWAGPDVPQVMVVLCTPEKDGKLGRVVEITLAAPSL
jgi:hypothetical protein